MEVVLWLTFSEGESLLNSGDYDAAIAKFKKVLSIDHSFQPVYYFLGEAYLRKGMPENAISIWKKGLEKFKPWPLVETSILFAYNDAGEICYRKGKLDKAREYFERSIKLGVRNFSPISRLNATKHEQLSILVSNACKYLGIIYIKLGIPEKAIPFLKKALEVDPSISGVQGHLKKAIQLCKENFEDDPLLDAISDIPTRDLSFVGNQRLMRIMRYSTEAKRNILGLRYPKPEQKMCNYCGKSFFEGDVKNMYILELGFPITYCPKCLASAFWGAFKSKKDKETLKKDLANLVKAFGFIPPKKLFNNRNLAKIIPRERMHQIIPALIEITHPEIYEKEFGSWLKALISSEILSGKTYQLTFGTMCIAEDGHECRSLAEKLIDDWLFNNGIPHIVEPFYPRDETLNPDGLMKADWKVGNKFIEYFGLIGIREYEQKVAIKQELCEKHGIQLVEVAPDDLFNLDIKLKVLRNRE